MSGNETHFSRRNMLLALGVGSAATVGTLAGTQAGQSEVESFKDMLWHSRPGRDNVPLATASLDDWSLQIGSMFQAATGQVLKLVDVRAFPDAGKRPQGMRDPAFVAGFQILSGGQLRDEFTHRVSHAKGGTFDMFMTVGSPDKPGRMLAVFG